MTLSTRFLVVITSLFTLGCAIDLRADPLQTVQIRIAQGFSSQAQIQVPFGKSFELISFVEFGSVSSSKRVLTDRGAVIAEATPVDRASTVLTRANLQIAGPASLTLAFANINSTSNFDGAILTYRLNDNTEPVAAVSPSSGTAVVIPSDATGPVEILLESSTDLITWTAATPGSYGASTEKRFFRVRAVNP